MGHHEFPQIPKNPRKLWISFGDGEKWQGSKRPLDSYYVRSSKISKIDVYSNLSLGVTPSVMVNTLFSRNFSGKLWISIGDGQKWRLPAGFKFLLLGHQKISKWPTYNSRHSFFCEILAKNCGFQSRMTRNYKRLKRPWIFTGVRLPKIQKFLFAVSWALKWTI